MADARPSKRQKIAQERNPFIDDEAVVDHDKPEDDVDEDDDFIVQEADDVDVDIDSRVHARVDAVLRAEEEEADDAGEECHYVNAWEDDNHDGDVVLSQEDGLWEIPCIVGREYGALEALLAAGQQEDRPIVKSAIFREDHPGRIYIELAPGPATAERKQEARQVAARVSMNMLIPRSTIRFIPCPDATALLNVDGKVWRAGMWARIRGPKPYQGDIGFVFSRSHKITKEKTLWIAIVPRIDIHTASKKLSRRLPAQPLDVKEIKKYLNVDIEFGRDFIFRDQYFNYAGFLLLKLQDINLYPAHPFPAVPLLEEFDRFLRLPVLSKSKWAEHRLGVIQQRTRTHDRVKILDGKFKGMIGVILAVCNNEAEIYLPEEEDTIIVGITALQTELQHGDYVRVLNGEHEGQQGYITKVNGEWVDVTDPKQLTEIHVFAVDVEFYTAPPVIQLQTHTFEVGDEIRRRGGPDVGIVRAIHDGWLRVAIDSNANPIDIFYKDALHTTSPKTNMIIDAAKKAQIDMYSQYCGRYAMITVGPWKGYRGLVKTSHPDGQLGLQLDTRLEQLTHFAFDEVLVQEEKLAMALPPPISAFSAEPPAVIPERRPLSIPFPGLDRMVETPWRPQYQAPPSESGSAVRRERLRLADQERLKLPVPTWLLSGEFVPHRIRLHDITCDGPMVVYVMPTEDRSKVRVLDVPGIREVPVENLRHVTPEKNYDLVVPLTGEYRGKMMKVKSFGPDECTLTVYGAKRIQKKNYQHPRCNTMDLAVTCPPRE